MTNAHPRRRTGRSQSHYLGAVLAALAGLACGTPHDEPSDPAPVRPPATTDEPRPSGCDEPAPPGETGPGLLPPDELEPGGDPCLGCGRGFVPPRSRAFLDAYAADPGERACG